MSGTARGARRGGKPDGPHLVGMDRHSLQETGADVIALVPG